MRFIVSGILLTAAMAVLPASAVAAEPSASVEATAPRFPTPFQMSVIGLSLTAVAVVGARASQRSSNTMMYTVLASLALTAVMVAYADRVHENFIKAGIRAAQEQHAARAGN